MKSKPAGKSVTSRKESMANAGGRKEAHKKKVELETESKKDKNTPVKAKFSSVTPKTGRAKSPYDKKKS